MGGKDRQNQAAEIELRNMVSADAEVVDKQMRLIAEENTEYLIVTLECVEDIAAEQEIGGD
jgi:hypothetical protein